MVTKLHGQNLKSISSNDHGKTEGWSRRSTIAGKTEGPQHGKEREIWNSSKAIQSRKTLVPAFHEAEWLGFSTKDNSRSAASR